MLNETRSESAVPATGGHPKALPQTLRLPWVEPIKAVAILWVFLNHLAERLCGPPFFGNPNNDWPPIGERLTQLSPLTGFGRWDLPLTVVRDIAWLGDQGVTLFLIASGFGLAWSCLERGNRSLNWIDFYRRRLGKIFPMWLTAHFCFLLPLALLGFRLSMLDSQLYWSLLGIRILPSQLYYGVSAWWYVTLLLQLYLVFPLLWTGLRRFGAMRILAFTWAVALSLRAAGLFYFHDYLDAWSRGAIFISRLPEFVFGIVAAHWYFHLRSEGGRQLSRRSLFITGLLLFAAGTAASFTLAGMAVATLLSGVGAFLFLYSTLAGTRPAADRRTGILDWIGRHSLSLFLVHQIFIQVLVPRAGTGYTLPRAFAGILLSLLLTVATALILERIAQVSQNVIARNVVRFGAGGLAWRLASVAGVAWAMLVASELVVRSADPQEPWDLGWGERASLQPDDIFGWKLQPSRSTRLRWESYDYRVTANSLGFPGPEYSVQKPPGVLRILVTGDAFTSAEGVDTGQSWPRLLEKNLNEPPSNLHSEVLDFAITGYGPNQYDAIVKRFGPLYHPDVIVIGLFVNDYGDVLTTNDEFRRSIGFGKPNPDGLASILTFRHTASLVRKYGMKFVFEQLRKPYSNGYFLGQFHFLERNNPEITGEGRKLMTDRLTNIKEVADGLGARLLIAMVPAAPQVCGADALPYWPKHTDISDASKFDIDLPQRTTGTIAAKLSITSLDLRLALGQTKAAACPYQPHNMHWTALGHRLVANYIALALKESLNVRRR